MPEEVTRYHDEMAVRLRAEQADPSVMYLVVRKGTELAFPACSARSTSDPHPVAPDDREEREEQDERRRDEPGEHGPGAKELRQSYEQRKDRGNVATAPRPRPGIEDERENREDELAD